MIACSQRQDVNASTSTAGATLSAVDRRTLTRVLHVPPLASASSAPAFPKGSSFHADLLPTPLPPPSLPAQKPGRALQGGLSRSFSASGGAAAEHSSLPSLNGTENSEAARQTSESAPSAPAPTNDAAHKPVPAPQHVPENHAEAAPSRAATSGLPPLSPSQAPGASLQQLSADQPAVASTSQKPDAEQVHTVHGEALRHNQGPMGDAANQVNHQLNLKAPCNKTCLHPSLGNLVACIVYRVCCSYMSVPKFYAVCPGASLSAHKYKAAQCRPHLQLTCTHTAPSCIRDVFIVISIHGLSRSQVWRGKLLQLRIKHDHRMRAQEEV